MEPGITHCTVLQGGLHLRRTSQRLQLPADRLVYRQPGIRAGIHEESDPTRTRLVHIHIDISLSAHGAIHLGGYPMVLRSVT